jgi:HNH endonuclease
MNYTSDFIARFWSHVTKTESCWLWGAYRTKTGYGTITYEKQSLLTHRVAWELLCGPIPKGLLVCHNCPNGDNPSCCNPEHLFLGSYKDNMVDAAQKGRMASGNRNGTRLYPERIARGEQINTAKLTERDVVEIRRLSSEEHLSARVLGRMFNISGVMVGKIVSRVSWKHVA